MGRRREEQRVRLRLARQRPGHVRERERAGQTPEPKRPGQWRDVTVVGGLVSVLVGAAVAVWTVLAAQDQLDQSKKADAQEARAQASRISTWTMQEKGGKWRVHVMNRSPDPIGNVYLTFQVLPAGMPQVAWAVMLTSVPPCSDMTFRQDQLGYDEDRRAMDSAPEGITMFSTFSTPVPDKPSDKGWQSLTDMDPWLLSGAVGFTDRDGVPWMRANGRLIQTGAPLPNLPGIQGDVVGLPAVRAMDGCDERS
ncbi:hypothetical protein TUSST3_86860 [Streptomyces sp. TUS-ST3]|nr:hypothetical protein TUSST3_86860 [Streptomyces sp. TUS-ST3]